LLCEDCGQNEAELAHGHPRILANAKIKMGSPRYMSLLLHSLQRIPDSGRRIQLPAEIRTRKRGSLQGVVGLTTFSIEGYASKGVVDGPSGRHTITFYTDLMDQLSDEAAIAVIAHELAHAWLNEHLRPETSRTREEDADLLAEMWGFRDELDALAAETDPIAEQDP